MIRRLFAALLAAMVIALAPTAAVGQYAEDEFDAAVSTTNPAAGEGFTVTVTAPDGTDVTLTISSEAGYGEVLSETAVNGEAVFTVTLSDEGVYTLVASTADGTVIETLSVTVGDGVAGEDDGDGVAGPALPETGATATPLIIGGVLLLLVGIGIVVFVRRRQNI